MVPLPEIPEGFAPRTVHGLEALRVYEELKCYEDEAQRIEKRNPNKNYSVDEIPDEITRTKLDLSKLDENLKNHEQNYSLPYSEMSQWVPRNYIKNSM